ncbi:MAG: hypothetical protein ACJA08_002658 [Cyclobacteriaceae bacterium]|jgi:hypothetical protein
MNRGGLIAFMFQVQDSQICDLANQNFVRHIGQIADLAELPESRKVPFGTDPP